MDTYIADDMATEGKPFRNVMLFGYLLAVLTPFVMWITDNKNYADKDVLLLTMAYFLLGSIGLYGWLYALKYKLVITAQKITVNTLFKRIQIDVSKITRFSCKRYKKSVFYQFRLFTDSGAFVISTRYCNEFSAILMKNDIDQVF